MKLFHVHRPSPALVVSVIALVIALSGTSYAAFSLPKNSVGEKQLRNGAVSNPKLRNGSVGPAKLKNGAVTTAKIANGAVTGAKVNLSTLGTVPSAIHANVADTATNASHAANADNATSADAAASPATLKSGQTLRGGYVASIANATGAGQFARAGQSFLFGLASSIPLANVHFIASGAPAPPQCPGTVTAPAAASGNLCVYEQTGVNATTTIWDPTTGQQGASTFGFYVRIASVAAGAAVSYGTWAVTG